MAHRSRLGGFIIDCRTGDLASAAEFWSRALGSETRPGEDELYVRLEPQGGLHAEVQKVDHPSRVHIDIETDDVVAEVARLERLGATRVAEVKDWVVMEAPTGHRFCVVPAQTEDFEREANTWPDA
jgi:predicted enzyme related to lactoylglutathione lyase